MIPQTAYYSHKVTDQNGDVHEIGLSGLIEEGETFAQASAQVAEMVLAQSQEFVINFDEEITNIETEINQLDSEIQEKLDSLGSFTNFAELNGLDFKPPEFPFTKNPQKPEEENTDEQQGTETGETSGSEAEPSGTP